MIPREEYYLRGIHCSPFSFPMAAKRCTEQLGVIGRDSPVIMHHFIIAFHRDDVTEFNLDGETAQQIVEEWVRRCLPGFLCVIGTHTQGSQRDPNIHCHVIVNSVRLQELPSEMEHPVTVRAGRRFRTSKATFLEMKQILRSLFRRYHLRGWEREDRSGRRVSDRERLASSRGQRKLDRKNEKIRKSGGTVSETEFLTDKEKIRRAVDACIAQCSDEAQLRIMLALEYGISVWDKGELWQYRLEESDRSFSCNSLGRRYWGISIRDRLERQQEGKEDLFLSSAEPHYEEYPLSREDVSRVLDQQHIRDASDLRAHMEKLRDTMKTCLRILPKYRQIYADAFRGFCARRNELRRLRDPRRTERPISWEEYHEEMMRALKKRLHAKEESESLSVEIRGIEEGLPYLEEMLTRLPERLEPEKEPAVVRPSMDREDR